MADFILYLLNYRVMVFSFQDNFLPNDVLLELNKTLDLFNRFNMLCEQLCIIYIELNSLLLKVLNMLNNVSFFNLGTTSINALCMSVKFLLCIAFLIFARGGIPRFRFDYLTKLGWIRFLSLVLLSILIEILILSMM